MLPDQTRWTIIDRAAEGDAACREVFARTYEPVIRAYLGARWRNTPDIEHLDDALQEVFVDCFTEGGVLTRADRQRSFRAFFYGVMRNVALRHEDRRRRRSRERSPATGFDRESDELHVTQAFDRAWAQSIMDQAAALQRDRASVKGERARRRLELLDLRFREDMPIRQIAALWGVAPAYLHHEYAKARKEFHQALRDVVASVHSGPSAAVDAECARLLQCF